MNFITHDYFLLSLALLLFTLLFIRNKSKPNPVDPRAIAEYHKITKHFYNRSMPLTKKRRERMIRRLDKQVYMLGLKYGYLGWGFGGGGKRVPA